MASLLKGSSQWHLQPGGRGPTPDAVFGLYTRDEEWEGPTSGLATFLASYPTGSTHPTWSYLKLETWEPTYAEGNMSRVRLTYTGHPSGGSAPTLKLQRMLKSESKAITLVRTFERAWRFWELEVGGLTQVEWSNIKQEAPGELSYIYYTPTLTFSYCRPALVKEPLYESQATSELAGLTPATLNQTTRQTDSNWTTMEGVATASDLSVYTTIGDTSLPAIKNMRTYWEFEDGQQTGTPQLRVADISCEPRGAWYQVTETWEIELV
jgi:hypothetical protein